MVLKRDGNEGCKAISAISSAAAASFWKTNVKQDVWVAKGSPTTSHMGDFFSVKLTQPSSIAAKVKGGSEGIFPL